MTQEPQADYPMDREAFQMLMRVVAATIASLNEWKEPPVTSASFLDALREEARDFAPRHSVRPAAHAIVQGWIGTFEILVDDPDFYLPSC